MINRLRRFSIVFWLFCGISLILSLMGCLDIHYDKPGVTHQISIIDYLMVIPTLVLSLFLDTEWEPYERAICYGLLMIPVVFASIAVVLRMTAKAIDEQTITAMNLVADHKKKSKEE